MAWQLLLGAPIDSASSVSDSGRRADTERLDDVQDTFDGGYGHFGHWRSRHRIGPREVGPAGGLHRRPIVGVIQQ